MGKKKKKLKKAIDYETYTWAIKERDIPDILYSLHKCMQGGGTLEQFLSKNNITKRSWDKLIRESKEPQHSVEDGMLRYQAYWHRKLMRALNSNKVNTNLMKLQVENALGWTRHGEEIEKNAHKSIKIVYKCYEGSKQQKKFLKKKAKYLKEKELEDANE